MENQYMISNVRTAMAPGAGDVDFAWATAVRSVGTAKAADGSTVMTAAAKASGFAICAMERKPSDATAARGINSTTSASDPLFDMIC
jgi:hypothetical protein